MKSRLTLIFTALVVLLGAMAWVVQHRNTVAHAPPLAAAAAPAAPAVALAPVRAPAVEPAANQPAPALTAPAAAPAPTLSAAGNAPFAAPAAPQREALPVVRLTASGEAAYVARAGDTLSELALALLGGDSRENRHAVIAANPTLQSNPDLVLAGQTYLIKLPSSGAKPAPLENAPLPDDVLSLEYSAQPGDTVRLLAANLLGGDTKLNRDAIIAENDSLQRDPDYLVSGRSYTIPAANGLAMDPNLPPPKVPTTRPDADDILRVGMGRTLRYTAQAGDTVSKLAIALMGSDTPANRELIIKNNRNLMQDPDQIIAGTTYWIAAPTAESKP